MTSHGEPPAVFSIVRIGSLLVSLLVALGSGTNYVSMYTCTYCLCVLTALYTRHSQVIRLGAAARLLRCLLTVLGIAYGPQLASRLHLTRTRLNVISLSGTSTSAPPPYLLFRMLCLSHTQQSEYMGPPLSWANSSTLKVPGPYSQSLSFPSS